MVGLRDRLPKCDELIKKCDELINQHLSGQAFSVASQARTEIEIELKYLRHESERPRRSTSDTSRVSSADARTLLHLVSHC